MKNHIIYVSTHDTRKRDYAAFEYYASKNLPKPLIKRYLENTTNLIGPQMVLEADEILNDENLKWIIYDKVVKGNNLLEKSLENVLYQIAGDNKELKEKVNLIIEIGKGQKKVVERNQGRKEATTKSELADMIETIVTSDDTSQMKVHLHAETKEQDAAFVTPTTPGDTITWKIRGNKIQKIEEIECIMGGTILDKFVEPPYELPNGDWFGRIKKKQKKDPEIGKYNIHFRVANDNTVYVEDPDVPSVKPPKNNN